MYCDINRVICHCRRRRSAASQRNEGARSYPIDRHLTFEKHVSPVRDRAQPKAIRHIRHLLTTQLAQTLACRLILSSLDYCNAVLHGIPSSNIYSSPQATWQRADYVVTSILSIRSTTTTRLSEPFTSTAFAKRAFSCSAPATWNSLPRTVTDNDSLGPFKSRLKTRHFRFL